MRPSQPTPQVTVVIPAYNSARWIEQTLASVAAQTVGSANLEVIVVDDGSTDDTAERAKRFLSSTTLSWQVLGQVNGGPSKARNVGWRAGRAPWVQFLDADDLIDPEKIEIQLRAAEGPIERIAAVYSPWTKFGRLDATWEIDRVCRPHFGDDVVADYFNSDTVATGSQLYSRWSLEQTKGWNETHAHGEDHELLLQVAFTGGKFVNVDCGRPLFFYRREGQSLSKIAGRKQGESFLRLAELIENERRKRDELTPARASSIAQLYGRGIRCLAYFDWPAARRWFERVYALDPDYRPALNDRFQKLCCFLGFRRTVWLTSRIQRIRYRLRRGASPQLVTVDPPPFARHFSAGE